MHNTNLYSRTADDSIYLNDNRYNAPKESFKQIASILDLQNQSADKSLVDIGCATGEFLYYVRQLNSDIRLTGIEYSDKMVETSSEFLKPYSIDIVQGDANHLEALKDSSFDYTTTIGVTSIFDDFRPSFNEMIRVTRDGGYCLNHMLVNELGIDVIIKYINPETDQLESGWNKFSIASIRKFLETHPHVSEVEFIKHEMPVDIEQKKDLMRSWTREVNGKKVLWNGLNMEIALYHIVFKVKK